MIRTFISVSKKAVLAAFAVGAAAFACSSASGDVTKARLGTLRKTDYVVVDVTGSGSSGGGTGTVAYADVLTSVTNLVASGFILTPDATNALRRVDDLRTYDYRVVPEGPWTWSSSDRGLVEDLTGVIPVYGSSGWVVNHSPSNGWALLSATAAPATSESVTLNFYPGTGTHVFTATAVRRKVPVLRADTLALNSTVTNLAQYATNIWVTLDSYITYLENYATNNYWAAYLANVRATSLELWRKGVTNDLLLASATVGNPTNGIKQSSYFSSDNTQLTGTIRGIAEPLAATAELQARAKSLPNDYTKLTNNAVFKSVSSGYDARFAPTSTAVTVATHTTQIADLEAAVDYSTNNATLVSTVTNIATGVTRAFGPFVTYVTASDGSVSAVTVGSRPETATVALWSSAASYRQNDFVRFGNRVYVCTADPDATVGPSDWAAQTGKWDLVQVGPQSFAAGVTNVADGAASRADGGMVRAEGPYAHAEGVYTRADGDASHAEGTSTRASGTFTHAEGISTKAAGLATHAEGGTTSADGISTHAEGVLTGAGGLASHAEGYGTSARGPVAKADGVYTTAGDGSLSHVSGTVTNYVAGAHAAGWGAVATNQTAFVWQGAPKTRDILAGAPEAADRYYDHGAGTFNLNPVGGLQGIWIGSTNLHDHIVASSPPVVLPQTWALADVTNASGESVTAKDVGAVGSSMELYGEYVTTRSFEEVPARSSWAQRNGWYPTVLYQYSNTLSHAEDSFGLLYHEGNIAGPYYALCTGKNGNIWSLPRRQESNYHHELLDDESTIQFSKVDHPTTLAGYGLSGDAYTKTQANNTFLGKNDTAERAKSLYVPSSGFSVGLRPRIYYDEENMKWCFSDTYDAYSIAAAEDIYTKTEIDDAIQDAKEFSVNHADTYCLSKTGGVINGSLRVSDGVSFGTTEGLNPVVTDEMEGTEFLFTTFAGGTKESALRPDGSYILTKTSAKEEYPILTNAYTKAETEDKFLGADSIRYTSVTNGVNGFKFYLVWSNTGVLTSYVTNAPSAFCGFFVDYDYINPEGWGYTLKCDLSGSYSQSPVIATRGGGLWYVDAWASQFFTGNPTGDLDFEQEAAGHAVDAYSLAGICQSQVIGWVAEKFAPVKTYGLSMVTNSNANGNTRLYIENDSVKIDDEWGSMTHYDRMQAEKDGITVTSATNVNNNATVTLEYAKYTPKAIKFYSKVDGTVQANATYKFPTGVTGTRTLATQSATSLAAMLNDVATNETVQVASAGEMTDAEAVASVRSNICCFVRSDVTQTVNKVKAEFWDDQLQVNWTLRMVNGEMKLYATTNTNMSVAN